MANSTPLRETQTEALLERVTRQPQWLGAGLVLCVLLALVVIVNPVHEFPVEDDWDYSKTVLNLLQTGAFYRLQVTQATVLFPALWGALWSNLLGYSFTTLRLATLVLAGAVLLFFYALLGELAFDLPRRVLATLALLLAPAFIYLAFSFMTDIPLLFGMLGALYFYTRAWRTNDPRLAVVGSGLAALGFLARQVGALVPLAFAVFVILYRGSPARTASEFASQARRPQTTQWIVCGAALPALVVGGYLIWSQFLGGANWADRARTFSGTLSFWLQFDTPGVFVRRYAIAAATLGIYMLPLWLALYRGIPAARRAWQSSSRLVQGGIALAALLIVIALVRAAARSEWFPYLTDILTRRGLRPYLGFFAESWGASRPVIFSLPLSAALTVLGGGLAIVVSALILERWGKPIPAALGLVYVTTLVLAAASLTFFTYFERYLLPLLPGAIVLLLDSTRHVRLDMRAGAVGVLLVALVSIALMQDYFAWNQARWNAGAALLAQGTPVEQIDGGYEWNGWHLYDASMLYIAAHDVPMAIDPWKYILDPEYLIAFQPLPDYRIAQEYPFATPLRAGGWDRIYLLQRKAR